jgi:hypothetical protein
MILFTGCPTPFVGGWLALALAVFMVSCSTSGNTNGNGPCALLLVNPQMISPANGATGVPTNIGLMYFAGPAGEYTHADVVLTPAAGRSILGGTFVSAPSPLPSNASSSGGFGVVLEASVTALTPKTTYTVSVTEAAATQCSHFSGSSGSFTTQ